MKSRRLWFLTNIVTREKYEGLSTNSTRNMLRTIPTQEKVNWVLWTEGWNDWAPLATVESTAMAPEIFFAPPESYFVEMTKVRNENTMTLWLDPYQFSAEDVKVEEITINVKSKQGDGKPDKLNIDRNRPINDESLISIHKRQADKRTSERMDLRLEVILFTTKGSFRCRSVNISIGGILLESEIPTHFMREQIEVVILNPVDKTYSLKFEGQVITDSHDRRRLKFTQHKGESRPRLEALLQDYKARANYAS